MRTVLLALAGLSLVVALVPPARADAVPSDALPSDALHRIRRQLAKYDLDGSGTTSVIAELGTLLADDPAPADRRELTFLRAMAAGDLLLLSYRHRREGLAERVAKAYGADRSVLSSALIEDLEGLRLGAYETAVRDEVAALEALRALRNERGWSSGDDVPGSRSAALFVDVVSRELGSAHPVRALSRLGVHPLRVDDSGPAAASKPWAAFTEEGRRAAAALQAASRAVTRLQKKRREDPFVRALDPLIRADGAVIASARLAPRVLLPDLPVTQVTSGASRNADGAEPTPREARPEVLVIVDDRTLHYAWVPRLRVARGELVPVAAGRPVLPATVRVPLPRSYRPAVRPIGRVTRALSETVGAKRPRLGIAASPSTEAHVVARVVKSAEEAGLTIRSLVAAEPDGSARSIAVRTVRALDFGDSHSPLHVRVRLGGYTMDTPRGEVELPRIRDDGGLRFDVNGLSDRAAKIRSQGSSLDFMTVAPFGPVMAAAVRIVPDQEPLTFVVP